MDAHTTPLPSLTQLRQLQRANSAASRLQALERLTGAPGQQTGLARSNTVAAAGGVDAQDGLERRSVVGRRMMERLGNRVAARQKPQQQDHVDNGPDATATPQIQLHPPTNPPSAFPLGLPLDPTPRSASRQTARSASVTGSDSGSAVFEYESHLSRNPSARIAREEQELPVTVRRVEEVLVSPIREGFRNPVEQPVRETPTRYTLTDQAPVQTPPRRGDSHHYTDTPDTRASTVSGTPESRTSSSAIPMIPPFDPSALAAYPLAPPLEPVMSHHRLERRDDSMSRFPQGIGSGTGSAYGFAEERQSAEIAEEEYFDRFGEGQAEDDAGSDMTEKMGREGDDLQAQSRSRSREGSFMSWEDVGDDAQIQHLPSDDERSTSSGVIDRLRDTWRKHRASRDGSVSADSHSGDANNGRVTPLLNSSTNTSTSNMVASYSLPPGQTSPMPTADPHDVRLQNPKLSPFLPTPMPGMGGQFGGFTPGPLLQLASDSLVPTMAGLGLGNGIGGNSTASLPEAGLGISQSSSAAASYYDLSARAEASSPTPHDTNPPSPLGVVGKKSWLAEAFFAGAQGGAAISAAPSRSNSQKRKPSLTEMMRRKPSILERYTGRKEQRERERQGEEAGRGMAPPVSLSGQRAREMTAQSSPPAWPPLLSVRKASGSRQASEQPTVSTVLEAGDERSTVYRPDASESQAIDATNEPSSRRPSVREKLLPGGPRSEMMDKLNAVLALAPDARPDVLDDPPRRLVMSLPVRQVVNLHTVKDRYLFLFSDILVIAKPLPDPESDVGVSLDTQFTVKSIVPLQNVTLTADQQQGTAEVSLRDPIVQEFIDLFAEDPDCAVELLERKADLQADIKTFASVLFKTPELDKHQLGKYVCAPQREALLRAFLRRFHFESLSIEQAFRMLLLAVRLPRDTRAHANAISAMADAWHAANASKVPFDTNLIVELIWSMIRLNDSLQPSVSSEEPSNVSAEEFIAEIRERDSQGLLSDDFLRGIYESIRDMPLMQALRTSQVAELSRAITLIPGRMPTRLSHNSWSEPIKVCIPEPDADFVIQLSGNGLVFDPPELKFSMGTVASFRVKGDKHGLRTMLFRRSGKNAPYYGNLANSHTFVVERSFMQHIFHLAFQNHLGLKRKYIYSFQDAGTKANTFDILQQLIERTREAKQNWKDTPVMSSASRQLADQISIRVLQSSLITKGDSLKVSGSRKRKQDHPGGTPSRRPSNPASIHPGTHNLRNPTWRPEYLHHDTSPALEQAYKFDDTASFREGAEIGDPDAGPTAASAHSNNDSAHAGKDIVLICRQNSLLPVVLGFLRYGLPTEAMGAAQSVSGHSGEHAVSAAG